MSVFHRGELAGDDFGRGGGAGNRRAVPEFHRLGIAQDGEQGRRVGAAQRAQAQSFGFENHGRDHARWGCGGQKNYEAAGCFRAVAASYCPLQNGPLAPIPKYGTKHSRGFPKPSVREWHYCAGAKPRRTRVAGQLCAFGNAMWTFSNKFGALCDDMGRWEW